MLKNWLGGALLLCSSTVSAATWMIQYPQQEEQLAHRSTYPLAVLELALKHTGVRYKMVSSTKVLTQRRAIKQLKANREINVIWSMTDNEREETLLPVRIPIYKGLIGWRLFLVNPGDQNQFAQFQELEELRRYTPVQHYDWPDTKILQANGFEVVTSSVYDSLFDLLEHERANFFPRSVVEIWSELDKSGRSDRLSVEPHLGVRYPTATYFFFNRRNHVLAKLVETGLERAIAAGEFDQLFLERHKEYLSKANITKRVFFELENPVLPEKTPLQREELWYSVN